MNLTIRILYAALMLATSACILSADPFAPRFMVALDELCSDGDLALSIPLMRIHIDDETTIMLRAEHVLQTGEYDFAQSKIILRPLYTTIAPHDRDALLWRKPNGSDVKLRFSVAAIKPPTALLAEKTRTAIASNMCRAYAGSGAIAWVAADSFEWAVVYSERIIFYYENGSLKSFMLPSGVNVLAKCEGGMIRELQANDTTVLALTSVSNQETRINARGSQITVHHDNGGRLISIMRQNGNEAARFEYTTDNLLSAATFEGSRRRYTWAKTQRPLPAVITWVKPCYIQAISEKSFDYKVTDDTITMRTRLPFGPCKTTALRIRHGTIVSIREYK